MEDVNYREPLVSIIIPVYNSENSLENCLNSILSQDYKNIEIILVDDGSHDSSPEICKKYEEEHPNQIAFVCQKNGGPSVARNKGIEMSQGKYVAFVDSDDTITTDMVSTMISKAEAENVEMVICAYWKVGRDGKTKQMFTLPEGLYANEDQKKVLYSLLNENSGDIRPYSWIRLTRKSVFDESGLRFCDRLYRSEDYHFWTRVHSKIKSVYLLSETPLYNYYENDSSVTHSHVNGYWEDVLFIYSDLNKRFEDDPIIREKLNVMLVKRSLIALNNATFCERTKDAHRELVQVIKNQDLNRVIKKLNDCGAMRFTRYRFLMSKGLKWTIVIKYMIRWVKCHK